MKNEIKNKLMDKLSGKYSVEAVENYINQNENFFDKILSPELQKIF